MPRAPASESSQVVMLMRVRYGARVASAGGERAGQSGDIQFQPGFKGFLKRLSGGGEGLQLDILLSSYRGPCRPWDSPNMGPRKG